MDKDIELKIQKLVKSMQKSVKKVKEIDAIKDVLDADRIAEMNPDEVTADKTGTINKNKDKKLDKCADDPECDCDDMEKCADVEGCDCHCNKKDKKIKKGEEFVTDMLSKFETISKAYLAKQEDARMATSSEQPKLKETLVGHAKTGQKTGVPKLDAAIADGTDKGRMALPEERPKKPGSTRAGPVQDSSETKSRMKEAGQKMKEAGSHLRQPSKDRRMVSRDELKALKVSKMKKLMAAKNKIGKLAASEGKK